MGPVLLRAERIIDSFVLMHLPLFSVDSCILVQAVSVSIETRDLVYPSCHTRIALSKMKLDDWLIMQFSFNSAINASAFQKDRPVEGTKWNHEFVGAL